MMNRETNLLMNLNLTEIIRACREGDRAAQRQLYEASKRKMFVMCLRYARSREDAEDILQEGYVKVFRDIHQYSGEGNFEGWMRKVIVNTALQFLRKQRSRPFEVDFEEHAFRFEYQAAESGDDIGKERTEEILELMQDMPDGFRTVLNLYILEGYSHAEISEICGISVGTSKSQLNRAKAYLKKKIEKKLIGE